MSVMLHTKEVSQFRGRQAAVDVVSGFPQKPARQTDDMSGYLPPGWWILPSAIIGLGVWSAAGYAVLRWVTQ
jgi:hypothetical protein